MKISPKTKYLLLWGAIPGIAGLLAGQLLPWENHPAPASAQHSQVVVASSSAFEPADQTLPEEKVPEEFPRRPKSTRDFLRQHAAHQRVEELLVEINKLPPGEDRLDGIRELAQAWSPLDHAGVMQWLGTLTDPKEQNIAYRCFIASWCNGDTPEASAWVAALPQGALRDALGLVVSNSLEYWEPAASLIWALASTPADEATGKVLQQRVQGVAQYDYETATQLISQSKLPDSAKRQLLETALTASNKARKAPKAPAK